MEQQSRPNAPCRRCPSRDTFRLRKIRSYDNDVFRCVRCGFLFSPATPSAPSVRPERREQAVHPTAKLDVQPIPEVEEPAPCPTRGHASQLSHETNNPKLDSYANAASETTPGCPQDVLQLQPEPGAAPQSAPNRPPKRPRQLAHKTNNSKLDSYANAAIETTSSYEKKIFSYDSGRAVADRTAPNNTPPDRR